jgi:hypothetical protein
MVRGEYWLISFFPQAALLGLSAIYGIVTLDFFTVSPH